MTTRAPQAWEFVKRDGWWFMPLGTGMVVLLVLFVWMLVSRRERVGDFVRPAGLNFPLSVVDRPGACIYIYSNGSGVGLTAVPKTVLNGAGC